MRISRFTILAILPALIASVACRQSKSGPVAPTLAVEFELPYVEAEPARHINLMEGSKAGTETPLDLLRPLDAAASPSTHDTLSLQFTVNAGKVITTVYKIPPDTDPLRYADGHKRLLGTHSARLDETVTLDELEKLGYVPFTIRIVKATPPQIAHPALSSKVPSMQIVIAERTPPYFGDADTPSCSVVLHNKSSLGVMAFVLSEGKYGESQGQESFGSYGRAVIDTGKDSSPYLISFGHGAQMTPQGLVNLPAPPQQVVLEAALFSDGSYEGEPRATAHLKAQEAENLAFYRVIRPVMDRIVGDSSLNDDTRVAQIKDEIFRISSEPDEATLHSFEVEFPDVAATDLATDLTRGIDTAKDQIWHDLYGYVHNCCQYPPPDHISVPEWWRHLRGRIEPLLNSPR